MGKLSLKATLDLALLKPVVKPASPNNGDREVGDDEGLWLLCKQRGRAIGQG
jgi:hypothetical protein